MQRNLRIQSLSVESIGLVHPSVPPDRRSPIVLNAENDFARTARRTCVGSTIVSNHPTSLHSPNLVSMIWLGCLVAVVSLAIQLLGITLQRQSHIEIGVHHQRKRTLWLLGLTLFIVANVFGLLIQITTLPLIILLPLQSIGLIFNLVFSCLLLHEPFTWKLGVGTVVIAVGATTIAYNGQTPTNHDPLEVVVRKLTAPAFVLWFSTTLIVALLLCLLNLACVRRRVVRGFTFGMISGILTAHTFLFAKLIIDAVVALMRTALGNPTCYVLLATMLTIIGCQLAAFNLGLKYLSTLIIYPFCFFVFNLVNLVNDVVYNSLDVGASLAWVVFGLVLVLFGVVLISWDTTTESEDYVVVPETSYDFDREPLMLKRVLSFEQSQLMNLYGCDDVA